MNIRLGKYSFGTGDRFGKEGKAQLMAIIKLKELGVEVTPVWNKSNREHETVNTQPESVLKEAQQAVAALDFQESYLVDADHINLETVEKYIVNSDFFTIDVAKYIGKATKKEEEQKFLDFFEEYKNGIHIPEGEKISFSEADIQKMLDTFLLPMQKASEVYKKIKSAKLASFFTEVSIDEVDKPQTPAELFFILAALSFYKVPVDTIAPKFTGNFYKGVDYQGDLEQFQTEFEKDLKVIAFAVKEFGFPEKLKLSVHSGSDKFSIYPVINRLIKKNNSGLHLKTAGTTWLEEVIGLAESEGEAFLFIKALYEEALDRYDELTKNYKEVLDIDVDKLPSPDSFKSGKELADAIRHDQNASSYNPHLRQLMHCSYKIAAEKQQFFILLDENRERIEKNVMNNLLERHLKPLFLPV